LDLDLDRIAWDRFRGLGLLVCHPFGKLQQMVSFRQQQSEAKTMDGTHRVGWGLENKATLGYESPA